MGFSGARQRPGFAKWAKNDSLMVLRKMGSQCKSVRAAKAAAQGLHSVRSWMGLLRTAFLVLYTRSLNGANPISGTEKVRQSHLLRMTQLRPRTAGSAACSPARAGGTSRAEQRGDERGRRRRDNRSDPKTAVPDPGKATAQRWNGD